MLISQTKKILFLATFAMVALSACSKGSSTSLKTQNSQTAIQTIDSGKVSFSDINVSESASGTKIKVSGIVTPRPISSKNIKIPGHIHIVLNSADNQVLESITARTHRTYANSRIWHFDGLIDAPSENSHVVVKYHSSHK